MTCLKSLLITTSTNKLDDNTNQTGVWLEDLAAPYFILKDGGEFITIASPEGGLIPLDPNSNFAAAVTESTKRFQEDPQAMYHFGHSLPVSEMKAVDYDMVLLVGGYGTMWDFADNDNLKKLLQDFISQQKPVGLVGHAVVALTSLLTDAGEPFVKDRNITSFSDSEEAFVKIDERPPFSLEEKLISLGAVYSKGPDFKSHTVTDGNIVTGQNPASSVETATQLIQMAHCMAEQVS